MSRKTPIPPPPARRLCLACARWLPPVGSPELAVSERDCAHPPDEIADLRHASAKDLELVVRMAKEAHAARAAALVKSGALALRVSFVRPSNVVSIDAARRSPRAHGRESARPAS